MKSKILIDIYSDTICPWCYIGLNKLKFAIKEFSIARFEITWRPFQLNPDMPLKGMDRQEYLNLKFGRYQSARKTYKSIYDVGIKNKIYFQFEKINITPNSFGSHKLLALAYKLRKQTEVAETLFYYYFIEGVNIGDFNQLLKISKQHNIYDQNTLNYLKSEEDNKNLLLEETYARQLGIKSVPCFIINKEIVLFGAQEISFFLDIFKKVLK